MEANVLLRGPVRLMVLWMNKPGFPRRRDTLSVGTSFV